MRILIRADGAGKKMSQRFSLRFGMFQLRKRTMIRCEGLMHQIGSYFFCTILPRRTHCLFDLFKRVNAATS